MSLRKITYHPSSDEELVELIAAADNSAFTELYHRHGQKIFSYFFRMLWKDKNLAEDFTQELFMKLIRNAASFEKEKVFSTWMYSIAHNMCKNEYRKKEIRQQHLSMVAKQHPSAEAVNPDHKRFKNALQRFLQSLSEEKRSLYTLRFHENLSVPEISQIIEVPEGTVKSRIFHLMKEIKNELKEFENILTYP